MKQATATKDRFDASSDQMKDVFDGTSDQIEGRVQQDEQLE